MPLEWLVSLGRVCGVCWVNSGLLGSFGCALGVVGFIRGRWVRSGTTWWSFGSFGVVGILRVRPGGC